MKVEVINTGTEILLGSITNTHLGFMARQLFPLGLRVQRQIAVPDGDAIRGALVDAFAQAEVVLVTGGLGPTTDDITREITAELLGVELVYDPAIMQAIEERFARRNMKVTGRVERQSFVPKGATVLQNPNGTAPGLYFNLEHSEKIRSSSSVIRHLFLLPGPPRELQPMFDDFVVPILKTLLPAGEIPEFRNYRVVGLGESNVEAIVGAQLLAIDGIELGYCARAGEVDLRVIGSRSVVASADEIILKHLGKHIASTDNRSLEEVVVKLLAARGKKVAVAESCTGGFLANRITNVPGASDVFVEGFVTYANEAKVRALKINPHLIEAHGAVSAEVATAMAENARDGASVDYALSTTGIAGPGGGSEEKPVGTVFIALASKHAATIVQKHAFPTGRENFKWLVTQTALDLLRRQLA
jgi:nicotinamide-nucleotide amidase